MEIDGVIRLLAGLALSTLLIGVGIFVYDFRRLPSLNEQDKDLTLRYRSNKIISTFFVLGGMFGLLAFMAAFYNMVFVRHDCSLDEIEIPLTVIGVASTFSLWILFWLFVFLINRKALRTLRIKTS